MSDPLLPKSECQECGGTGSVPHFVPLFPQIDSRACPECFPGYRVCICCGESSPSDDCPTCDARRAALSTSEEVVYCVHCATEHAGWCDAAREALPEIAPSSAGAPDA